MTIKGSLLLSLAIFSSTLIMAGNETYRTYMLNGLYHDKIFGYTLAPAIDGNGYIILYSYSDFMNGYASGYYLQKRDTLGNTVWCKNIPEQESWYSPNSDTVFVKSYSIESFYRTSDNHNLMVGMTDSSVAPTVGNTLHFKMVSFTKFDDAGNFLWTKNNLFESSYPNTYIKTKFDHETNSTYCYGAYPYLTKFDSSGEFLWCKKFVDSSIISIKDILPLHTGNLLIIGDRFMTGYFCMFLDSAGNILWQRGINQGPQLNFAEYDSSSNTIRMFGTNNSQISVFDLDSSQSTLTSYSFSNTLFGNGSHTLYPFASLPESSVLLYIDTFYVIIDSSFQTKTLFDAGNEREDWHVNISEHPVYAAFINNKIVDIYSHYYDDWWASYSTASSSIRELTLSGGNCANADSFIHQLVPTPLTLFPCNISDSSVYQLGTFNSATFDSLVSDTSTLITCLFDYIVTTAPIKFEVYPNPVSSILYINCNDKSDFDLEIYNMVGTCILKSNFRNQTSLNCSEFSPGIYFVKIFNKDQVGTKKFVLEN
jgi:hypothetical protein